MSTATSLKCGSEICHSLLDKTPFSEPINEVMSMNGNNKIIVSGNYFDEVACNKAMRSVGAIRHALEKANSPGNYKAPKEEVVASYTAGLFISALITIVVTVFTLFHYSMYVAVVYVVLAILAWCDMRKKVSVTPETHAEVLAIRLGEHTPFDLDAFNSLLDKINQDGVYRMDEIRKWTSEEYNKVNDYMYKFYPQLVDCDE